MKQPRRFLIIAVACAVTIGAIWIFVRRWLQSRQAGGTVEVMFSASSDDSVITRFVCMHVFETCTGAERKVRKGIVGVSSRGRVVLIKTNADFDAGKLGSMRLVDGVVNVREVDQP